MLRFSTTLVSRVNAPALFVRRLQILGRDTHSVDLDTGAVTLLLESDLKGRQKDIPSEAVIGWIEGDRNEPVTTENFKENPEAMKKMQDVIAQHIYQDPWFVPQATFQGEGYLSLPDFRNLPPVGRVAGNLASQ